MQAHPATELFPMMGETELAELARDIRESGLQVPIVIYQGMILDGRNRSKACEIAGVQPHYQEWQGEGSPTAWVISLNLHRRHLTQSQKATVAVEALPIFEQEAKERQRQAAEATNTLLGRETSETLPLFVEEASAKGESAEKAGDALGVSRAYVAAAKKLKKEAPDLYELVHQGKLTLTEAQRKLKERKREAERERNRQLVEAAPPATITSINGQQYQTIVLDPPWDWGDEGDCDQYGRARPTYDTMPLADIVALPVGDLAANNAHIYLWITNRSLPKGFRLLEEWGFRYVTMLTWVKPSIGMGNYFRGSTEQVLFGVRGSLPLLRKDVGTHFSAPRPKRHSAKPDAFYELVESCSPGPWLEMFSRQERSGWVAWGAEVGSCPVL